jgi:transposase
LAAHQKKARAEGRIIVFIDETAFYLLAGVVRTYAPRSQTPLLRVRLSRDHLAAICGITAAGRLLLWVQGRAFDGVGVLVFIKYLLRQIGGKLLLIWDGAPIHADGAVKGFLAAGGAERVAVEQLPGYAPDLNPAEGVWNYLKHVELRNISYHDLAELHHGLSLAAARLRRKPKLIRGFFKQYGY